MASMGGASSAGEELRAGSCDVDGMGDLLHTLTSKTAALAFSDLGRGAMAQGAQKLPGPEDRWRPGWKQPPSKEEVKKQLQGDSRRSYKNCVRLQGDVFSHPQPLRPGKMLDTWAVGRMNVPDRTFAKEASSIRYRAKAEAFGETKDDFCTQLHREWLGKHRTIRDKEMHPVYHALVRLDTAKAGVEDIAQKKALARDLASREHAVKPNLGENERNALDKVRSAVRVTRMFNKTVGIDRVAQADARAKENLYLAKSAPCLRARPRTPPHRPQHLRGWGPANANSRQLRASTPWIQDDDGRDLAKRGRMPRPASVA